MVRGSWAQIHAFDFFYFFSTSCFPRENDVAGIDVNMGCPKEYSTKVNWFLICLTNTGYRVKANNKMLPDSGLDPVLDGENAQKSQLAKLDCGP